MTAPLRACPDCGPVSEDLVCGECGKKSVEMICHRCTKPILRGEARYTAGEYNGKYSHYECKRVADEKLDRDLRSMPGEFNSVGRRLADLLKGLR